MRALIGYTGFVGSTLNKQTKFDDLYRSTNINEISGKHYDLIVCAGAPGQKWLANKEPENDLGNIYNLIEQLKCVSCKQFVLISTVDVFQNPEGVDEKTAIDTHSLHAYGLNRYILEQYVSDNFKNHLIIRLPGLVGPGLRKNIIYDFLNENNLEKINSTDSFQFYPMVNLWFDIQKALLNKISLLHLTAEPITVAEVAQDCFNQSFNNKLERAALNYDMLTIHAKIFGGEMGYTYSKKETILAIRAYVQSENCYIR